MSIPDCSFIERAVSYANINALRMALYQATRDPEIGAIPTKRVVRAGAESLTIEPEDQARIRRKAVEFLRIHAGDQADQEISNEERDELVQMAEGRDVNAHDLNMHRLNPSFDEFPHEARWSDGNQVPDGFTVAIIGGGLSGIAMAVHLERVGIPYHLFERRSEVGGVWSINTYPDARVDTASVLYQFSFEKNHPWTEHFARQNEVRCYLEGVARKWGVREKIRFSHDVQLARYDAQRCEWDLDIKVAGERMVRHTASVVVSASGLFATPRTLDVPGVENFEGQIVHTTQWRDGVDCAGKKVAIIGNGSTGVQLLSSISAVADSVYVCQRTPQWISPRPGYGAPIEQELRWLADAMPYYWNWDKFVAGMGQMELWKLLLVDDQWIREGGKVNPRNDALRETLKGYIAEQVEGRQDLVDVLVPDYPPMTRRPVVDNNWYASLLRDNVELVADSVASFDEHALYTGGGRRLDVDLVVAAIGFDAQRYLWPTQYYGERGISLEQQWAKEGPKAYLGMTVPGFPNLFMLYGPNSQPVAGGCGLPEWFEIWSGYIAQAIIAMIESGNAAMSVRPDVHEEYNRRLDEEADRTVYLMDDSAKTKNYYVNDFGRLQVNIPFTGEQFFAMLAQPTLSDFELTPKGGCE
jgi:4-hydroxyacetophenone monooxygenase